MKQFITSESVAKGHPDKICDRISDAVLDAILAKDKDARCACECIVTTDFVLIMGEITTTADVDIETIARETIKNIGYTKDGIGFKWDTCQVIVKIKKQSADIALGVDKSLELKSCKIGDKDCGKDVYDLIGAGDQGMMFGYATNETDEMLPLPVVLSNKMCKKLDEVRESGELKYLRPDGKGQVTVEYVDGKPVRVDTVVLSAQHDDSVSIETLRKDLKESVIDKIIDKKYLDKDTKYFINPTGRFEIGGPNGDSGLTGRKIIVDTYGGFCPHGGGCFSGKDPTKVDRSATYMVRYIAKNLVKAGLCERCEIQVAYAIGVAHPVSVMVNSYGTGKLSDDKLVEIVKKEFDLRPYAIIEKLGLRAPIFFETSAYGHFGNPNFAWEKLDKVNDLKKYLA